VVFLEHKLLYGTTGDVPDEEYVIPVGKADIKRTGQDVTIVAWSKMVMETMQAAEELAAEGIDVEVIDIRTLSPLDEDVIFQSVRKTNRVVVVQEAWRNTGFGAEIASRIQENVFDHLDAPVLRLAGLDTPIPFSPHLRDSSIPGKKDIIEAIRELARE
jgi:pyruvate dehydrogenase E1 component beta subunit